MKKIVLVICLFLTNSVFSYMTHVGNTTPYKVKAVITYAGVSCDDENVVLNPNGGYKRFNKGCCLKHVKFVGLEGPIKGAESSELGGKATGFGISCRSNNFRVKLSGKTLVVESF